MGAAEAVAINEQAKANLYRKMREESCLAIERLANALLYTTAGNAKPELERAQQHINRAVAIATTLDAE